MQKEFITLKSFLEGQKHDVRMNDIRITKLEEQNKTIEAQITDLKLQIAKI
jgi:cell division protein FtsB